MLKCTEDEPGAERLQVQEDGGALLLQSRGYNVLRRILGRTQVGECVLSEVNTF
jgi:hypothetical protein